MVNVSCVLTALAAAGVGVGVQDQFKFVASVYALSPSYQSQRRRTRAFDIGGFGGSVRAPRVETIPHQGARDAAASTAVPRYEPRENIEPKTMRSSPGMAINVCLLSLMSVSLIPSSGGLQWSQSSGQCAEFVLSHPATLWYA